VVPIRIDGLFEVKESGKKFARPGQIQVRIGLPVRYTQDAKPEEIAADLARLVAGL
jgi:1-acyl-sn-glycerol-3-phosphate acyltransferase